MKKKYNNINWSEIEHRYITGNESYKTLGEVYKVHPTQVSKMGRAGEWTKKRAEYRKDVAEKAKAASELTAVDNLKKLGNVAGQAVNTMSKYFSADGMVYEPQEFKQLTGALKDLTAVLRDIFDITESKGEETSDNAIRVIVPEGLEEYDS